MSLLRLPTLQPEPTKCQKMGGRIYYLSPWLCSDYLYFKYLSLRHVPNIISNASLFYAFVIFNEESDCLLLCSKSRM